MKRVSDVITERYPQGMDLVEQDEIRLYSIHFTSSLHTTLKQRIRIILKAHLTLIKDVGIPRNYYLMKVTQGEVDEVGTHHLLVEPTSPEFQRMDRAERRRLVSAINSHH